RGAFVKAYTDKDIHDAFAIRILLESYAISNIDPEALEQERGEIEALIARCTSGNRRDEKELDVLVHETAIRLCQNAALLDIYRTLYTKIGLFRDISIADKKMSDLANRSHAVMLDDTLALLVSRPNVLLTAHQAFLTEEALQNIAEETIKNLDAYFSGGLLENEICYLCDRDKAGAECRKNRKERCF
ncbi:MAG: FCD domain-containing protein, partial [Clostridia bacterium]|nr:FCD domain-containing protein [Clostridia bacterium]